MRLTGEETCPVLEVLFLPWRCLLVPRRRLSQTDSSNRPQSSQNLVFPYQEVRLFHVELGEVGLEDGFDRMWGDMSDFSARLRKKTEIPSGYHREHLPLVVRCTSPKLFWSTTDTKMTSLQVISVPSYRHPQPLSILSAALQIHEPGIKQHCWILPAFSTHTMNAVRVSSCFTLKYMFLKDFHKLAFTN